MAAMAVAMHRWNARVNLPVRRVRIAEVMVAAGHVLPLEAHQSAGVAVALTKRTAVDRAVVVVRRQAEVGILKMAVGRDAGAENMRKMTWTFSSFRRFGVMTLPGIRDGLKTGSLS